MNRKPSTPSGFVESHAGIARVFGVTVDCVKNWSRAGMPKRTPDGYNLAAVFRWWLRQPSNRQHLAAWAVDHLTGADAEAGAGGTAT